MKFSITMKEIRKYNTVELIDFLKSQEYLGLSETAIKILENEEINGLAFIDITKEELQSYGMKDGPAKNLSKSARKKS